MSPTALLILAAFVRPHDTDVRLRSFVLPHARALVPIAAQVGISSGTTEPLRLLELSMSADSGWERTIEIDEILRGDPEYVMVEDLIAGLPVALTEVHRHDGGHEHVHGHDDPIPVTADLREAVEDVRIRLDRLRERWQLGVEEPFRQPTFTIDLDQLFFADAAPGTVARLRFELRYERSQGAVETVTSEAAIVWLGPRASVPPSFSAAIAPAGVTIAAGDLHVHSCHGEAAGACAPSGNCAAESFQTSGSFSYAQLRTQYEALGSAWYTATDHSYCVNSDAEYQAIVAETVAASDASFHVYPDIELSSDEVGTQQGSDLANALCLGTTAANHLGAHDIQTRFAGGGDGFLGFCNGIFSDVLQPFTTNVAAIRAQGGFPIVNHPAATSYGWNSFQATAGIEANALHGVEVWNGATQTGQGGNVDSWVDWLRAGRLLYAYGGSDTHDQAFDYGANHALLVGEPFSAAAVMDALRAGRCYVGNGPCLILEVDQGGATRLMGDRVALPANPPVQPITVRAHVDFGALAGTVTLYAGEVGAAAETVLGTSATISGAGVFEFPSSVGGVNARTWLRAYAVSSDGTRSAYSNPVFFEPGAGSPFEEFCSGAAGNCTPCPCANDAAPMTSGGCLNTSGMSARLLASGVPSLGADTMRFELRAGTPSTFALLVSADDRLPNNPTNPCFYAASGVQSIALDGLRCVGGALLRHGARPTDALGDVGVTTPGWGPPNGPPGGLIAQGAFTAGQARQFQSFYRDFTTAGCGTGQNTSAAVSVVIAP